MEGGREGRSEEEEEKYSVIDRVDGRRDSRHGVK